jgi:hypothetical protein
MTIYQENYMVENLWHLIFACLQLLAFIFLVENECRMYQIQKTNSTYNDFISKKKSKRMG